MGDRAIRTGEWRPRLVTELRGKRLGIVGAGPIAARLVELAKALGMEVTAWTRNPSPERERALGCRFVTLPELFRTSSAVSVHVASTPETEGLIGEELLSLLPQDAILVNTARGAVLDEAALARLLGEGRLLGAGLDVFTEEPPPPDHPLLQTGRTVLTPHVGYHTPEASQELMRVWLENMLAFARGRPQNVRG
jgi:phosphoglycerate dehydrogenase-like enzyme